MLLHILDRPTEIEGDEELLAEIPRFRAQDWWFRLTPMWRPLIRACFATLWPLHIPIMGPP